MPGEWDGKFFEKLKNTSELWTSDAAGDENLAGKTLRKKGFLANLKAVFRDKAHGLRRVCQRPWAY